MTKTRSDNRRARGRPLRVLILEDDPLDAELTVTILKRAGYVDDFEVIDSREQFQEKLKQGDYDVILADYNLRTWTALDALGIVKKSAKDLPMVVITGTLGDEAAVECIKQGAADYVLKDRLQRLPVAVERTLRDKAQRVEAARLEEEIRRAKKEWELTFDAVPDPIFVLDPQYRIQRANRAATVALGLEFSKLIGRLCYEVVCSQSEPPPSCPHRRMLETGREAGVDLEYPHLRKTFYSTTSPLRDPNGTLRGCVHVLRDVTKRKQGEEALRVSEASYRSLILGATYGIFRCSVEGKFVTVNPALVAMLGHESEAELLGADLVNDVSQNRDGGGELLRQYRQKGRIDGVEVQWKRKDGTPITVRLSGRTVLDEQGALQGFEIIAEDVTERRQLEEQLRQAQKMEAIGQLAGGVAHDFNNFLTIITGFGQLVSDNIGCDHPLRKHVDEILHAGARAATVTRQLLAFSRRQVLSPRVLDLNSVVAGMGKMLTHLIGEDIQLETQLEKNLGRVKADPGQIEQVIMNLAVNARDAMPQGGRLIIETANVELDEAYGRCHGLAKIGPFVMLAVSDTGCGMDVQTQSHIFEPFFTTKEQSKGTGLGLATVYGIVKQTGGDIWIYSEPGRGSTFKVYLPRVEEAAETVAPAQPDGRAACGSETILLVEDEEGVRKLARSVLEAKGYRVLEAGHGEEALKVAQAYQASIDLLLADMVMPQMSGSKLAHRLIALRPSIRVIFMSGYSDKAALQQEVLGPGTPFLQKPFTPDSLARKVREVLDANHSQRT